MGQELTNGVLYSISLQEGQVSYTIHRVQLWLTSVNVSTGNRNETHMLWTIQGAGLEQLVEHLLPTFLGSDPSYNLTFLGTCRVFATPQQVLYLQFKRAISSILGTWLDQDSEDFHQPPEFPCLKMLLAYVQLNMPYSTDLEHCAHLLAQLELLESIEAEGEEDSGYLYSVMQLEASIRQETETLVVELKKSQSVELGENKQRNNNNDWLQAEEDGTGYRFQENVALTGTVKTQP
ncbi:hypothetical protein HPG69_015453 [Diceros bicornis minor]|uniref:N-terminal Ras-GEF domain-containing protein n=1 Tax=Diceros bicornis minor TaxID=77932 RepID=A0A7J7F1W1_DICBM|nr:hypothetical protein HPG69_015453 [Diceros bicornis minor]